MFSKACEYGIRSSIYITCQSLKGIRVSLGDVAKKIESPEAFTSKILQKLVKNKIILSVKGPGGGFEIDPQQIEKISLIQIVEALDGNILKRCSLGLSICSDSRPCPFHYSYKPVKDQLLKLFANTTLKDLTHGYENGDSYLKL